MFNSSKPTVGYGSCFTILRDPGAELSAALHPGTHDPAVRLPWHLSGSDSLSWPRGQPATLPVTEEMKNIRASEMQKPLRFRVLFIRLQWMRGPEISAGNWGWDKNSAPPGTAAPNLREGQGLGSAQDWAPSKLFQTGVRVTSWYSHGESLRFLRPEVRHLVGSCT